MQAIEDAIREGLLMRLPAGGRPLLWRNSLLFMEVKAGRLKSIPKWLWRLCEVGSKDAGYDSIFDPTGNYILALVPEGNQVRVVGFLVETRERVCFQRLLDDGYSSSFSIREDCLDRLLKVFFIWVAEDHRRRSIGTGLIGAAQHGIGRAKPYVAWCHPLSRDARELARALQPDAAPLVFHSC